jgi:DNA-binding LacI/PurR family transcriptional regulator
MMGANGDNRVTLREISESVGVGVSTISQILNKRPVRCAEKTRAKVLAAARELGYRPNTLASGLRGARTHTIGVIWALVGSHSPVQVTQGIADRINKLGYVTYVANNLGSPDVTKELLADFAWRRVDGVVIEINSDIDADFTAILSQFPAVVAVTSKPSEAAFDQLVLDRSLAFRAVADHFAKTGRRRPAMVTLVDSTRDKIDAFASGLQQHGISLPPELIIDLDWDLWQKSPVQCCHHTLDKYFPDGRVPFDALMCITDEIAVAAMAWLRAKGVRIPADVAVVGFNDNEFSRCLETPLASVARRNEEAVQRIEEMLCARLEDPSIAPQRSFLPMEFVWRESAG